MILHVSFSRRARSPVRSRAGLWLLAAGWVAICSAIASSPVGAAAHVPVSPTAACPNERIRDVSRSPSSDELRHALRIIDESPRRKPLAAEKIGRLVEALNVIAVAGRNEVEAADPSPGSGVSGRVKQRFTRLAYDESQSPQVIGAALDVIRNVYGKPDPDDQTRLSSAVDGATSGNDAGRLMAYAEALIALGPRWSAVAPAVQGVLDRTVVSPGMAGGRLVPCLAAAYVSIAFSRGVDYVGARLLSQVPVSNVVASSLTSPASHASARARVAFRPLAPLRRETREAIVVRLLQLPPDLSQTLLPSIAPALLSRGNASFVLDASFRDALRRTTIGTRAAASGEAISLAMMENYLANQDENAGQRARVAAAFRTAYHTFLDGPASASDAAALWSVYRTGSGFNEAMSDGDLTAGFVGRAKVDTAKARSLALRSTLGPAFAGAAWLSQHWPLAFALVVPLLWLGALGTAPVWLLRREAYLARVRDGDVPFVSKALTGCMAMLGLHGAFVQDRWVRAYARCRFEDPILGASSDVVPLPIDYRPQQARTLFDADALTPQHVAGFASGKRLRLLIAGEGGIGKTVLAGVVAGYLLHEDRAVRPFGHQAVAVSLSSDVDPKVSAESLPAIIRSKIEDVVERRLPCEESFVRDALVCGRIALVLDGVSEMPAAAVSAIRDFLARTSVAVVIATSRNETILGERFGTVVRPRRIAGGKALLDFINGSSRNARCELRRPARDVASEIERIAGGTMTPLLVRLYLQTMLSGEAPAGAPGLMERYFETLNDRVARSDRIPTDIAAAGAGLIAMACCIQSQLYRSSPIGLQTVRTLLGANADAHVAYFVERLCVLDRDAHGRVRFASDPLCEYFAGARFIERASSDYASTMALLDPAVGGERKRALYELTFKLSECAAAVLREEQRTRTELDVMRRLLDDVDALRSRLACDLGVHA